ncbi:hypothetical protein [Sphaerisporangium fuscum]|uniref:hypothetical protein n=1 Tax=Sphaerisporangium fuscum TaxID=2835868 RepID=UPI001BDD3FB7|nr:hypothetical protein [Sphaerisporangium fuscum]
MDEHRTKRRPYGDRVWPPAAEEGLPPSARLYGAPAPPSRVRVPFWLRRTLAYLAAVAAGTAVVAGVVAFAVGRLNAPGPALTVVDAAAGVRYPLPQGWRQGAVPPVTGFTSAASLDGSAVVMARPAAPVGTAGPRPAALELADLYARLLLHGDTVEVVDDRYVAVGGYTGHSRSLLAKYSDVVNQPSYLRVTLLTKGDRSVVVVGLAQPDDPRRRAEIDAVVDGLK